MPPTTLEIQVRNLSGKNITGPTYLPSALGDVTYQQEQLKEMYAHASASPAHSRMYLLTRQHPAESCNSYLSGGEGGLVSPPTGKGIKRRVLSVVWVKGLLHKASGDFFFSSPVPAEDERSKSQASVN